MMVETCAAKRQGLQVQGFVLRSTSTRLQHVNRLREPALEKSSGCTGTAPPCWTLSVVQSHERPGGTQVSEGGLWA